tara:strand:+ start:1193 stop:1789 length:597 start_codon:yes stop_codon:yes gene_type:complete
MKKVKLDNVKAEHFIGSWNIEDNDLCSEIIKFFEDNQELQKVGSTSSGVDFSVKKTTDITIDPLSLKQVKYKIFNTYFQKLNECFEDYKKDYSFLENMAKKVHIGHFNVQKYLQGDHFSKLHSERTNLSTTHRLFAWMTYLNDVDDGGTTDFEYYKLKIKPECGKTIIWPSEWTHAHSGTVLKSGSKYIITGWMHFAN